MTALVFVFAVFVTFEDPFADPVIEAPRFGLPSY